MYAVILAPGCSKSVAQEPSSSAFLPDHLLDLPSGRRMELPNMLISSLDVSMVEESYHEGCSC